MKWRDVDFSHSHIEFLIFRWHLRPSQDDPVNHWFHCQQADTIYKLALYKTLTHSLWLAPQKDAKHCCHSHDWEETERERQRWGESGEKEDLLFWLSKSEGCVHIWLCLSCLCLPLHVSAASAARKHLYLLDVQKEETLVLQNKAELVLNFNKSMNVLTSYMFCMLTGWPTDWLAAYDPDAIDGLSSVWLEAFALQWGQLRRSSWAPAVITLPSGRNCLRGKYSKTNDVSAVPQNCETESQDRCWHFHSWQSTMMFTLSFKSGVEPNDQYFGLAEQQWNSMCMSAVTVGWAAGGCYRNQFYALQYIRFGWLCSFTSFQWPCRLLIMKTR